MKPPTGERRVTPRLPAARRRQQLLDVALAVFGEQGFHPASMNDVAEAAGVTKPVLYQHFRSKRDLYREVLTDVGADLLEAITTATTTAESPHEQVELGFIACFGWVEGNQAAFRVLFGGGTRRDGEFAAQVFPEFFQTGRHQQLSIGVLVQEFIAEQLESKPVEQGEDPIGGVGRQVATEAGIDDVEGDPDGNRLAVA